MNTKQMRKYINNGRKYFKKEAVIAGDVKIVKYFYASGMRIYFIPKTSDRETITVWQRYEDIGFTQDQIDDMVVQAYNHDARNEFYF